VSINDKCPCNSGLKYKKCCKAYHDGKVAKNALLLMRSRYSAYACGEYRYIIKTTHESTRDSNFQSVKEFSKQTSFQNLEIIEFIDGEEEAYVTFKASLLSNGKDSSFTEKSRFLNEKNIWYYVDGDIQ
jgi:SEC-C motif-containing protein